jgi:hypothetical protein
VELGWEESPGVAGPLFKKLDGCQTEFGRSRLLDVLRTPPNAGERVAREALCRALASVEGLKMPNGRLMDLVSRTFRGQTDEQAGLVSDVLNLAQLRLTRPKVWEQIELDNRAALELVGQTTELRKQLVPLDAARGVVKGLRSLERLVAERCAARGWGAPGRTVRLNKLLRSWEGSKAITQTVDAIAEIDALHGFCKRAFQCGFTWPEVTAQPAGWDIEGMFHPLVDDPIPTDLTVGPCTSVVVLTGPNMAGKSTVVRALGIVLFLARLGLPVPSQRARLVVPSNLLVRLGGRDSVVDGLSGFMRDVRIAGSVADALGSGRPTAALLDEMFSGTNSDDLHDAVVYCCRVFSESQGIVLFTTHSVAAAHDAAGLPGVSATCLRGQWKGDRAVFDYRLHEGVSDDRLGMSLLKSERLRERTFHGRTIRDAGTPGGARTQL